MRTALAFWRRSQVSAPTSTLVVHRPGEINWMHVALKFALGLLQVFFFSGDLLPELARQAAPAAGAERSYKAHSRQNAGSHEIALARVHIKPL